MIVLDEAVDAARFAELPPQGLLDGIVTGLPVDFVGYGADGWHVGGGRPFPTFSFDRLAGTGSVVGVHPAGGGEFVQVSGVRGQTGTGPGPGDSGSPNLLAGSDIVMAIGSHVHRQAAPAAGTSPPASTPEAALDFVNSFLRMILKRGLTLNVKGQTPIEGGRGFGRVGRRACRRPR